VRTCSVSSPTILWFRRDLRCHDHPALRAAGDAGPVLALFVLDPLLWERAGPVRRARLAASLTALDAELGGRLLVVTGAPETAVPAVAAAVDAAEVHVSSDHGPYGARRDAAVAAVLEGAGRSLVATGSPYAVSPGRVRKADGTPYRVFTPFHRAWLEVPRRGPAGPPTATWVDATVAELGVADGRDALRAALDEAEPAWVDGAGETAARSAWNDFLDRVDDYPELRDRPDLDATSHLSAALRWGEIHPRTLLADLDHRATDGARAYARQLCWREFYADVLHHVPSSARTALYPAAEVPADHGPDADARFGAWAAGRTGYPFVDAGMRQLRTQGWMHNRLRMVTASFLVKDLHLPWERGAGWFLQHLVDGELANNQHGWQWVAGTGTDAAPYVRILNPVKQGLRFDPDGDYVRRWVPELRGVEGAAMHEPWRLPNGVPEGYVAPIVDHAEERAESLRRHATR
jgi:deoxyribodipyrimidine photo-lyase